MKPPLSVTHPEIASQWHPTKNGALTPTDVTRGVYTKVWWKCNVAADHEWCVSPWRRTVQHGGCPMCAGKALSITNCLATTNPIVASEWHLEKNEDLTPKDISGGSHEVFWWKCNAGHEWQASPNNRTKSNRPTGCLECLRLKAIRENCFAIKFPELISQWHSRNTTTPDEVTACSGKKFWWKCDVEADHEWEASINNRAKEQGCPFCANQRVSISNRLDLVCSEIAKEWHLGNALSPQDVTIGSTKKVFWQCLKNKDHIWKTKVYHRTKDKSGCPHCKSSRGESLIELKLKEIGVDFEHEYKFPDCQYKAPLRFDFAILNNGNVSALIEYQGIQHFKPVSFGGSECPKQKLSENKKRDEVKRNFCKERGLPLLEVCYLDGNIEKTVVHFIKRNPCFN